MKKTKKILSLVLVALMLTTISISVYGVKIDVTPYPEVEYGYSSEISVGKIRYIAQNRQSEYFSWNYWPSNSFGGYTGGPESECGTSSISMALSYVGINRTPKELLVDTDGWTGKMWGTQGEATSKAITISNDNIAKAMNDYINGNGKYSPLIIRIAPFSDTSKEHWVLLIGKIDENKYLALNPWHTNGTNGTFTVQINGGFATYNGTTNPLTNVNQWYNPNAILNTDPTTSERVEFNGHYYQVFDEGLDWFAAKARCEEMGGHLVTITTAEEQQAVIDILVVANRNSYWIGGYKTDGAFEWITGEKMSYSNWAWAQPDNHNNNGEDALQIYRIANPPAGNRPFEWNDLLSNGYCDEEDTFFGLNNIGFICEWETNPEKPTEPSTPDEPTPEPSTPDEPDEPKNEGNIFTKIIDFFKNIINKILSIFKW